MRVLVVDDDPEIQSFLRRGLVFEGYTVNLAADGKQALAAARDFPPDVVVLDILMPEIDGFEVCRRLRQVSDVPILMLTAKDTVPDKIAGLDSGADDYLVKPFAFDELLARIRALLRRRQPGGGYVLQLGDLIVDTASREVRRGGQLIELTAKEFELLELFMRNQRQVLTREVIYEKVWGYDFGGESNIIEVYVRYLRSKLESDHRPKLIHTVRGAGYVLKE
ncbi:MAG: response regulator transcription factor [Chloroflexi bacterium]|nr:response regulator transcription factor [Chloroflexota bacterium]MDA8188711.1 response regulator transcription factor [Dehalococcoidales bacterium]